MSDAPDRVHLFSYRFEGADYVLEITAASADEARARLGQLAWARYDGVLVAKIPASVGLSHPLIRWVRNLAKRLFQLDVS